jgi:hypothetical protein
MQKSLIAFTLLTFAGIAMAQSDGKAVPVKFSRGSSSATIAGSVQGYAYTDYTLAASAGQTLTVGMKSRSTSCYFNVLPPDTDSAMFIGDIGGTNFSRRLPDDGKVRIRVYLVRAAARRNEKASFSLNVKVTGSAVPASTSSSDAKIPGTRFHAKSMVPAKNYLQPELKECEAFVVRRNGTGNATVEFRTKNDRRRVLFLNGKPVSSDSASKMTSARKGDVTILSFGDSKTADETFEVPDALILGG